MNILRSFFFTEHVIENIRTWSATFQHITECTPTVMPLSWCTHEHARRQSKRHMFSHWRPGRLSGWAGYRALWLADSQKGICWVSTILRIFIKKCVNLNYCPLIIKHRVFHLCLGADCDDEQQWRGSSVARAWSVQFQSACYADWLAGRLWWRRWKGGSGVLLSFSLSLKFRIINVHVPWWCWGVVLLITWICTSILVLDLTWVCLVQVSSR